VQADAYDGFRANFLHGRQPMLAAVAARLQGQRDLVWVDMGGGTGWNVEAMAEIMGGLGAFRQVYVVDLCKALCEQARQRVTKQGWTNVEVIEGDACTVELPRGDKADVVTFSYSLSMIPVFHGAVDRAIVLAKPSCLFGVADFYVSDKYDEPARQNSTLTRLFWRSVFDFDGIYIGPERRAYLGHVLEQEYEMNSAGHIPFVPLIKAPYYVWVGRMKGASAHHRIDTRASKPKPKGFPSTFIYSMTWEDPREDAKVTRDPRPRGVAVLAVAQRAYALLGVCARASRSSRCSRTMWCCR
jgi:betaine lipid synthase